MGFHDSAPWPDEYIELKPGFGWWCIATLMSNDFTNYHTGAEARYKWHRWLKAIWQCIETKLSHRGLGYD